MTTIELFVFIQVLDFVTTLIGIRMGGTEMSPFVRWMMEFHPVGGLTAVKILGFSMGGFCIWSHRVKVLTWVNYVFGGIVIWNLYNIAGAMGVTVLMASR